MVAPLADSNTRYGASHYMRSREAHAPRFDAFLRRHHVTCRHLPHRSTYTYSYLVLSYCRLATFAHIPEKSHSVVHSPHAKSASRAQMNSPVMRGYTATITAQRPLAGPAKKARRLLQMVGMRRTLLSPKELPKRRPGAEQTVMMRCVYVEPSLLFLMSCI